MVRGFPWLEGMSKIDSLIIRTVPNTSLMLYSFVPLLLYVSEGIGAIRFHGLSKLDKHVVSTLI